MHSSLKHLFTSSSLYLSATLYFIPSFSISAITQSVIYGIPGWDGIYLKNSYKLSVLLDADIKQVTYSNFIIFIKNSHWTLILTFGIKAVHHRLNNVQFGLDGEVYKVCVNQNVVWWAKLSVVLKKEARWVLSPAQKSKKWNQIHDQTLFNDPMRISVSWLTYTSLSFSCEGSFFFFSFALARSVSFLQNKRWVVAAFYVGSEWSNESHGSK